MVGSTYAFVLTSALLMGCASSLQVGLANAPGLGGATAETRVHDVIANGRDSCERSAFPQGDVLRGHIPPCAGTEPVAVAPILPLTQQPNTLNPPGYPLGICPNAWPGAGGAEKGMDAISLSPSGRLICSGPW